MASAELMNSWNRKDEKGSILPPLTPDEVDALSRHGVSPETRIRYSRYDDVARAAFIACDQFRVAGNSDLTAQTMAAFK